MLLDVQILIVKLCRHLRLHRQAIFNHHPSSQESDARHESELRRQEGEFESRLQSGAREAEAALEAARSEAAEEVKGRMEGERERALRAQAERLERKNKQVRLHHGGFELWIGIQLDSR